MFKTLANGIPTQLRKERTRIIREIDVAVDRAKSILLKRYVDRIFRGTDFNETFSGVL